MNHSPLRRIALAAAAVAVLSMAASAQTDAAFAAALGRLPSGLATTAQLKSKQQKPADQRTGVRVPRATLDQIIGLIMTLGKLEPAQPGSPYAALTYVDDSPELNAKFGHTTTTLFTKGTGDSLEIAAISFTTARSVVTPAGKRVDLFVYMLDGNGILVEASHHAGIQGPDGKLVELPAVKLDHLDPAVQAGFIKLLGRWA